MISHYYYRKITLLLWTTIIIYLKFSSAQDYFGSDEKAPGEVDSIGGGVVFYRTAKFFRYLLLQTALGKPRWEFPKEHVRINETSAETAFAKVVEITKFPREHLNLIDDFTKEVRYRTVYNVRKIVRYHPIELTDETEKELKKLPKRYKKYRWFGIDTAIEYASFPELQDVLNEVNKFLLSRD